MSTFVRRGFAVRILVVFALLFAAIPSFAALKTWTNGAGTGLWSNANNWSPPGVPGPADTVEIGTQTVTLDVTASVAGLTLNGGTITGPGNLSITGPFVWNGGTMSGSGTTTVTSSGSASWPNTTAFSTLTGRTLNLNGPSTYEDGNGFYLAINSAAVINNAGTFDIRADRLISSDGVASPRIVNTGTFKKSVGTGISRIYPLFDNNGGTVRAESGTLSFEAGGVGGGTFTAPSGGGLAFGGNQTFTPSSSITGAGSVSFCCSTQAIRGSYNVTGTTVISSGTVTFDNLASLGNLTLSGGTINGLGDLTISGVFTWNGGTLTGAGSTTVSNTGSLNWTNATANSLLDGRNLNLNGSSTYQAGNGFFLTLANGAIINNTSTFTLLADRQIASSSAAQKIVNSGTFTKTAGTGTSDIQPKLENSGTVRAVSGTMSFPNGLTNSGTLSFPIAGNSAFGKINVGGAFILAGTLHATTTGSYVPAPGTQFTVMTFGSSSGAFAPKNLSYPSGFFTDSYPGGTSLVLTANALPPTITNVNPTSGTTSGGTSVTITGTNFDTVSSVTFGGTAATINSRTSTSLNVTTPAHTAGAVDVSVTNLGGTATATGAFTYICPATSATITASGPTTFCAGGSVTLTANAGASYLWSTGATTQSIVVTTSGNYSVTVTDAQGCAANSAPRTVTVNPLPAVNITGPNSFCSGTSATLTANPSGGTGSYFYQWFNNASPITGATGATYITSSAGSFTVRVTDSASCSTTSAAHAVSVTATTAATITPSGPTTFCTGGSVTLTAPAGMNSYSWSTGATTQSINVTTSGSYTVSIIDGNGCAATSSPTVVTVNPLPAATVTASGPTTFCAGGSVTLTAPASMSAYSWSNGATTRSITVTTAGSYSVTVTNFNGCQATSAPTNVNVNPLPASTITASGPTAFCPGGNVTLTAPGGMSAYLWSTGATSQSINVTTGGNYTVRVTDSNGCSATSAPTTVTVNSATITASGPTNFCSGGSVTLTAPAGMNSYSWSTGATTQSINVTTSGSYSVTVVDPIGCTIPSAPTNVTVDTPATAVITAPTTVCGNSTGHTASVAAQLGATYNWTITGGSISSGAGTNSITFSAANSGSATVSVVVNSGSCSTTGSANITVSPAPAGTITAPSSVRPESADNSASVPSTVGATYSWTISGGVITAGQNSSSVTFTADRSGNVVLSLTATGVNGCVTVSSVTIPIGTALADLAVTVSGPTTAAATTPLRYSIDVTNLGPSSASTVTLGIAVVGVPISAVNVASNPTWTCGPSGPTVLCRAGTLSVGSALPITLEVPGGAAGNVSVHATVTATTADPRSTNNSSELVTSIAAPCGTTPPTLIAPAANASGISNPVAFSWNPVPNATSYEVVIIADGVAQTPTVTTATVENKVLSGRNITWYVIAHFADPSCAGLTSEQRSFTMAQPTVCSGGAPELLAPPAGSTLTSPVTFRWTAVPQATGYRVIVVVDNGGPQDVGTTATETVLTAPVPAGSIAWYVEALFAGCPAVASQRSTFAIPRPDPCASHVATRISAPINSATLTSSFVEFAWDRVVDADGYRVWVAVNGGTPQTLGTTSSTTFRGVVDAGSVEAWVETLFEGCPSIDSEHIRFTIPPATNCGTDRPVITAPLNGSTTNTSTVTFNWTPVNSATGYELWLSVDRAVPTLIGTTSGTTLSREVPEGPLQAFVRAIVDRCPARDSLPIQFTYTTACSTVPPAAISPAENASGLVSPISFVWRPVEGAATYELYTGTAAEVFTRRGTSTTPRFNNVQLPAGVTTWFVRALRPGCDPLQSAISRFTVAPPPTVCAQPQPPTLTAPATVTSGVSYVIRAQRTSGAGNLLIQEATTPEFSDGDNFVTPEEERRVSHINTGSQPRLYYYRARFFSNCGGPASDFSQTIAVYVLPSVAAGAEIQGSAPADQAQTITYTIPIDASQAGNSFTATPTEPWITVTPSSGIVPVGGLTLTATVRTAGLPVGTSIGGVTVTITTPTLRGRAGSDGTTTRTTTVSISLVQPVVPNPKSAPPPDALIIPAVAHATGMNSRFESDVRVTNTSAQIMKYQITFTPTGEAGIQNGKQTTLDIEPGRTIALDDILETWFNSATTAATGTLEIRPLTQVSTATTSAETTGLPNFVTFASSRTFSIGANGTFGQFVPAIPFANFIGPSSAGANATILSLQQIAQSAAYRTNLGLVEGSGQAATALVSVFSSAGQKLTEFPVQLTGGQHLQLNSFLAARNLQMTDGRVEVRLASPTGRVTAYASVIDQTTDDPVLVEPVNIVQTGSTRFVLGGVADILSGLANWRSDVRIFNPSTRSIDATLLFHALSGGAPRTAQITIAPNEVKRIDNTLASLFGVTNDGGALHINTAEPVNLIATARTYNQTATGTFGQSISAVTPNESAALGTRPLQLLQIEESTRYRTNVAVAETSGNPAKVELTIIPQDSKTSANIVLDLAANQYRQINSILRSAGYENAYNARVTVRVIEGTGRVTAFASVIDAVTQDPTLIPAQ